SERTIFIYDVILIPYVESNYIFNGRHPLRSLYWILAAVLLAGAIELAPLALKSLASGEVFGFIRSNQQSLYAALFLLLTYHLRRNSIAAYLYGLFMLVGYGSAATLAAFLVAIAIYVMYGRDRSLVFALRVPIIAVT